MGLGGKMQAGHSLSLIFLIRRLSPRTCAETLGEEQHNLAEVGHPCWGPTPL